MSPHPAAFCWLVGWLVAIHPPIQVTRTKMWMIGLLKRKGFMGVFLLASVPNMAFDLCGMCCGHFMMPFSTFFSAVLLGKAGVKASNGGGGGAWTGKLYVCVCMRCAFVCWMLGSIAPTKGLADKTQSQQWYVHEHVLLSYRLGVCALLWVLAIAGLVECSVTCGVCLRLFCCRRLP